MRFQNEAVSVLLANIVGILEILWKEIFCWYFQNILFINFGSKWLDPNNTVWATGGKTLSKSL